MIIRSFAVTAAAAAYLVWRVFFQPREGPSTEASDQRPPEDVSERCGGAADAAAHRHATGQQPATPAPASNQLAAPNNPAGAKGPDHISAGQSVVSSKQDILLGHAQESPTSPGISTANADEGDGIEPERDGNHHQLHTAAAADDGEEEDRADYMARRTLSSQLPPSHFMPAPAAAAAAARQAEATSPSRVAAAAAAAAAAARAPAAEGQPKLYLQVLTGPGASTTFSSIDRQLLTAKIGRMANCELSINDQEVSGRHAVISFSEQHRCWFLADLGSLNGTLLNSMVVSREGRQRGEQHQLADHDIVQLGTNTQIRVRCQPSPPRPQDAGSPSGQQPAAANTRNLSPRQQAAAATKPHTAAHPGLRVSCATLTRTGLLHVRHGSACEDVAVWHMPLPAPAAAASQAAPPAIGTTVDSAFRQLAESGDGADAAGSSGSGEAGLFCVFDGHGGGACSAEARTVVPAAVAREFGALQPMLVAAEGQGATRADAWERAYLAADAALACDEGCTATTVLLERQEGGCVAVQAANVGDSAAVLVRIRGDRDAFAAAPPLITQLTAEHKVAEASEHARLRARGFQGKTRLYGLALSRSLGDKFLKDQDVGLLAVPHVSEAFSIPPEEEAVVVLASDGLWDVVSCEAAGNAAVRILHGANGSAAAVAEGLMSMALLGRSQDDITVMALHIQRAASA